MRSVTATRLFVLSLLLPTLLLFARPVEMKTKQGGNPRFLISFPASSSRELLDGRMLLLISKDNAKEPRFQISEDLSTQQVFGVDVDGLRPGQEVVVDDSAFGYPVRSLLDLKPGEYWVQALLHRYETFKRSDGHTVKLPMDRGEGQQCGTARPEIFTAPRKR